MNEDVLKPIKRHEALVQFSREHHYGLLLVWKIRQGIKNKIEPERISNYTLFFFEKDLKLHFSQEETTLFTKMISDDVLKKQAILDHEKIYKLLDEIRINKTNNELLSSFANTLESHIRFEERILFNHIQQILTQSNNTILYTGDNKKKESNVDNNWSDHFWKNGNK